MNIADSLALFMPLNQCTILQLSNIYRIEHSSELKLLKLAVQQQVGMVDCGVFAIAYAVEICHGANPEKAIFQQEHMRQHLFVCLENQKFTPFPKGEDFQDSLPRPKRNQVKIKIYCTCRLPDIYDEKMIDCDNCHQWFHFRCVTDIDELDPPSQWVCSYCK